MLSVKRFAIVKFPIWFSAFLLFVGASTSFAKSQSNQALTAAEKWVVAQITKGDSADLKEQFADPEKRKLRARFLERLLTGTEIAGTPQQIGVYITGAIVEDPLVLRYAQIPLEFYFNNCQFDNLTTFEGANFTKLACFDACTFKKDFRFANAKGSTVFFGKTVFEGPTTFGGAEVSYLYASETHFKRATNFSHFKGETLFLENAVFEGPADFSMAQIKGNIQAEGVQFHSVSFNSMAAGYLNCSKGVFRGSVDLSMTHVASELIADDAQFRDTEDGVSFNKLKTVGLSANRTSFYGPISFAVVETESFAAEQAQFKDSKHAATFNAMKVTGNASLGRAVFEGPVDFKGVKVDAQLQMLGAEFRNQHQIADFRSMRVGYDAVFNNASFEGPVDFSGAIIAGSFAAEKTQFRNKTELIWLTLDCSGVGFFVGTTFAGPVSFADSNFLDLAIGNLQTGAASIPSLDLSRCVIKRRLRVGKVTIEKLIGRLLRAEGLADFTELVVKHSADLSYGEFAILDLSRSVWPQNPTDFHIQGLQYKNIRAGGNESESHKELLRLAGQTEYTMDVYTKLSEFFSRQGYRDDANQAFVAGKRRERELLPHWRPAWFASYFLDWVIGYGRHPERVGYLCLGIVSFGCVIFSSRKMELQDPKDLGTPKGKRRQYNRFWYSLGLFLPVVDLKTSEIWGPKSEFRFLRNYVRVHILLGWIFIPIFLAAISGFIK